MVSATLAIQHDPGITKGTTAERHTAGSTDVRRQQMDVAVLALAFAFLLLVAYTDLTYHSFLAPKAAIGLVALVPGLVFLVRMALPGTAGPSSRGTARLAIAFAAVAAVSSGFADVPLLALTGPADSATGLLFILLCAGSWAIGASLSNRRRAVLATIIVSAAALNAAIAWLQARGFVPPGLELEASGPLAGRAYGLLGNPVHLGALCAGALLLVGARLRRGVGTARWLAVTGVLAGGAQLSGGRSAIGLSLLAVGVTLARWWPGWRRGAMLVVAIVAGIQLSTAGVNVVTGTSRLGGEASREGTETRLTVWGYGAEAAAERPLLGWGPGRFAAATTPRYSPDATREGVFDNAHSWPVEYATTTGLLGLGLLLGWLGLAARAARGPLAWFAALYGLFALVEPMSMALTPVVLLSLGAAGPSRLEVEGRNRRSSRGSTVVAVAGATAGLLIAAPYLAGEHAMADAVLDTSPSAWRRADGLLPAWPDVAHLGARVSSYHGLVAEGGDHRRSALQLARQTVDRDPANARWWAHLGFLEMKWGSLAAAGAAFDEALDRLPWYPLALEGAAQAAAATDDTEGKDVACDRLSAVVRRLPDVCLTDSG